MQLYYCDCLYRSYVRAFIINTCTTIIYIHGQTEMNITCLSDILKDHSRSNAI